jgi:ABC-type amino acid transport system permease subunit
VYLVLGAMYLALIVPITIVARVVERRTHASRGL